MKTRHVLFAVGLTFAAAAPAGATDFVHVTNQTSLPATVTFASGAGCKLDKVDGADRRFCEGVTPGFDQPITVTNGRGKAYTITPPAQGALLFEINSDRMRCVSLRDDGLVLLSNAECEAAIDKDGE